MITQIKHNNSNNNGNNKQENEVVSEIGKRKQNRSNNNENNKQENEIVSEIRKRKQNRYGITIIEKPLSINDQIKFYIDNGKSFMLHGPSGIGKTRRIEEIDPDFVSIVLRNGMLPEEVIGKQIYPNNDKTTTGIWTPPSWYTKLCELCEKEPNKNHVLFIDEITNVKPTEQSLVYNLVLTHSIGPNIGKLPKNVVVVAAGNSKEESESAYNMPEPLFRRFEAHIELPLDIQDWLIWGSEPRKEKPEQTKIHPLVSAFVATYGDKVFYTGYDSEEPPKFAIDPRGWEQISDIIYSNNGVIAKELIENKVGKDIATSFIKFAQNPPLTLDDVLEGEYTKEDIPLKYDAKYALAMGLRNATEEQVKPVREFIANNLGNELLSVFDSAWVGDSNERAILIANQTLEENQQEKETKQSNSYKIKVDDFWNTTRYLAIEIKNKNELDFVCDVFDKMKKKWNSGKSYLEERHTATNAMITGSICLDNRGAFSNKEHYLNEGYTIYDFDEVDFSEYKSQSNYLQNSNAIITFDNLWDSNVTNALVIRDKNLVPTLQVILDNALGEYPLPSRAYNFKDNLVITNRGDILTDIVISGRFDATYYEYEEVDFSKYLSKLSFDKWSHSANNNSIIIYNQKELDFITKVINNSGKIFQDLPTKVKKNVVVCNDGGVLLDVGNKAEIGNACNIYKLKDIDFSKYVSEDEIDEIENNN